VLMDDTELGATEIGRIVRDVEGRTYVLSEVLGGGGQGTIYRTDQRNSLVKVFNEDETLRSASVRRVRRMPLSGLSVTAPMSVLEQNIGYVMRFQNDMTDVRSLRLAGRRTHPKDVWIDSGGLSRRLILAARVALVIEQLHSLGLIYGDLNPGNVMISEDPEFDAVTLIDLDNLEYIGSLEGKSFFFPFFGAPELAAGGAPPSFATDAFSLAVLIFETITAVQPFSGGRAVAGMMPKGREHDAASRCMVPSVIDGADDSNRCDHYPVHGPDRLANSRLLDVLSSALGPGRLNPERRPSASALRSAAFDAWSECVTCEHCEWSYLYSTQPNCPDCSSTSPTIEVGITFSGSQRPSHRFRIGTRTKAIDLSLAFPSLSSRATVPGQFVIRLGARQATIRAKADHADRVRIPPLLSSGDRFEVSGIGELVVTVGR
jgi:eukaryotic-like serine/threonine-protein kinase